MGFFECEFPTTISYRAMGGPGFSTTINTGLSGFEQRNKNWALARSKWQVSLMTPASFAGVEQTYADLVRSFFLAVSGKFDAFRLKDHLDFKFTDETIGVGDGTTLGPFQLIKTYTSGGRSYVRTILKPITSAVNDYKGNALTDTVTVKVGGSPVASSNWDIDETTGKILFHIGHAPASSAIVQASGQFHYPVRFDSDDLPLTVEESEVSAGRGITSWSVNLVEVRL
jgi:uncharacterized protein (TIGR02217 family)